MNAVNPIDPSEFFNFQGHNQLIGHTFFDFFLPGKSLEGTYHNARIPFQNATLDSDEHFPFKG